MCSFTDLEATEAERNPMSRKSKTSEVAVEAPAPAPILDATRLRELLQYNAETGIFRWRATGRGRKPPHEPAGSKHVEGYLTIRIDGRSYLCHRLAWLYAYGRWPFDQLDHINGIRTDNRLSNLRECSNLENCQNVRAHRDSSSRYVGVSRTKNGRWVAHICTAGTVRHIGTFDSEAAAAAAYATEKTTLHPFHSTRSGRQ